MMDFLRWLHDIKYFELVDMKNDLGLRPYKKVIEPLLSNDQKIKRKKFANWVRTNFRNEDTMRILFSDEKFFDIDGVYNSQND